MSIRLISTTLLLLFLSCTDSVRDTTPVDSTTVGDVDEPVSQQMRRRLRPPFQPGLDDGRVIVDVPPTEGDGPPFPVKTIRVTGRTSSSVTLRWHDRSGVEDGTRLRRREATGGWEDVAEFGPLSGFNDVTDSGLEPDHLYCYQFVAFNEHGDSFSPQRCAYTEGTEDRVVFRAQLILTTADVSGAATNNRVTAHLNSPPGIYVPSGNATVIDYGRNDFERGDQFTYDLELTGLTNLEDITLINLSKAGGNEWCLEDLSLLINNRLVYAEEFGSTEDSCLWFDNNSPEHTIGHEDLRSHSGWQEFVQTFPLFIDRLEIESRIESLIGNLIAGDDKILWGDRTDRAWVEATYRTQQIAGVDLDLEGDAPLWFNPSVDIDFFLNLRLVSDDDTWRMEISTSNLESNAEFDWFSETLSFILPCGPVASVALNESIPDCITALEDHIEDKIHRGWQPISRNFVVDPPCLEGSHPAVMLVPGDEEQELSGISFECVADEDSTRLQPGQPDLEETVAPGHP